MNDPKYDMDHNELYNYADEMEHTIRYIVKLANNGLNGVTANEDVLCDIIDSCREVVKDA